MLTIKQITENTEAVLRGLEKKHFKNAKETIDQVIALNNKRRSTQNELDKNLAEVNSLSRTIGQLMKEGKKEEAETARARVAELKEGNKELDAAMTQAATDMQNDERRQKRGSRNCTCPRCRTKRRQQRAGCCHDTGCNGYAECTLYHPQHSL